jgi:hypothetical protein
MSELIIESAVTTPVNSCTKRLQVSLEQDFLLGDLQNWSTGVGSPYPATPMSESRYDGVKCFDDCEPWTL